MSGGFQRRSFPISHQLGNFVFLQQSLTLLVSFRFPAQIRANLPGNGRLDVDFLGRVEAGKQLVNFALFDGIVFVVVTSSTAHRQTQPHGSQGRRPIEHLLRAELLQIDSSLAVCQGVAIEAGSNSLIQSRVGQQVSGQLLDRELVERKVTIQGVDHPLTIAPGVRAGLVLFVAVAVCITCQVKPGPGPLLTIVFRIEQTIDQMLVRLWSSISEKV